MLWSWLSSLEQGKTQDQSTAATDQQIADAMRVAGQVGPQGLATYDASAQPGLRELFALRGRQGQGYYDRYAAAERDLKGYGEQQGADIDESFEKQQGAWNLNPLSRGSTVGGTVSGNIDKNRLAEQRRLGEDLARMRIGVLSGLSGEALQADYGNTGNIANWFGTTAANRSNLATGGYNAMLDAIMGVNRVPPQQNMLPYQFGQNAVQPPNAPGFWQSAGPGIASGAAAGVGTLAAATIIVAVCIGEDSQLETPDGFKPLKEIKVGDEVLTDTGFFKKVVAKHLGNYKGEWDKVFVRLWQDARSLVVSRDHVIDGLRADEWIANEDMTWENCDPVRVGDILVEGEYDYMANGFAVRSLIGPDDVATLAAMEPENQVPVGA
jgi:hypothetical protein